MVASWTACKWCANGTKCNFLEVETMAEAHNDHQKPISKRIKRAAKRNWNANGPICVNMCESAKHLSAGIQTKSSQNMKWIGGFYDLSMGFRYGLCTAHLSGRTTTFAFFPLVVLLNALSICLAIASRSKVQFIVLFPLNWSWKSHKYCDF